MINKVYLYTIWQQWLFGSAIFKAKLKFWSKEILRISADLLRLTSHTNGLMQESKRSDIFLLPTRKGTICRSDKHLYHIGYPKYKLSSIIENE